MDNEKTTMLAVLQLLRKYNLKGTEELFKKEANLTDISADETQQTDSEVNSVLSAYKSEGDPALYEKAYSELKKFVEGSLDIYKHELGTILYPVLVHMYLELVYNNHSEEAKQLLEKFGGNLEEYYQNDLKRLSNVTRREQMAGNELTDTFKSNQFIIRMSRDTLSILKRHLQEKKHSVLLNIIQEHLYFDMYEGVARNKQQIDATSGAMVGEATRQDNKAKVYYGLLKEPEIQCMPPTEEEEDDTGGADGDKPKKKKAKKDPLFSKKTKSDPNAPPVGRMPLPNLKDADKLEKVKALREASKRVVLGPDTLPSICFYTLLNAVHRFSVTAAEVAEDSSLLATGFSDSCIKVWSLVPQKLRLMKTGEQLQDIDREADDVLVRMMDDRTAETSRSLFGHNGPIYSLSFSPDRNLLLSSSEDSTVRLWSLHTWTCVVCYKGHLFPVWCVRFSPHGYYFATSSHDKTARLWATDSHQPLRIFAGHYSDVDVVQFHPNSNYVATGSSDMTRVDFWHQPVRITAFYRDGNILVSGSLDSTIKLWDFTKLAEEMSLEDVNVSHNPDVKTNAETYLLRTFATKNTPVLTLHFSRRNLLLGVGMFEST
ncbi:Transcription initiation factor TFIID subunit 5 [Anthophora quadrimaculata]